MFTAADTKHLHVAASPSAAVVVCSLMCWSIQGAKSCKAARQLKHCTQAPQELVSTFFHKSTEDPSGLLIQLLDEKKILKKNQDISGYCIQKTTFYSFCPKRPI